MASKRGKKQSGPIKVGENDIPEIQCIVCHQTDCEIYIELKLSTYMFIGIHGKCLRYNVK
jgi:hypothetical protein